MRIGVAGLGKMGAAMAARLHEQGAQVTVWNRSREKAVASGLPVADTLHALCGRSDIVLTSLFDDGAATAVYRGSEGLLAAGRGKLFIETSTLSPAVQVSLFEAAMGAGAAFVECPVGGSIGPARAGRLLGLAGGEIDDLERARPVLQMLCRRIERMGPVGSGSLTKLAVNLPLLVFWQSFGEALALVRELGKDPAWLVSLFGETAGAPSILGTHAAAVAATLAGDRNVAPTFAVDAMRKDLRTLLAEGRARGMTLPLASRTLWVLDAISAAGQGDRDCSYVPAYWAGSERERA
ncbi:MAG TPA: NAD(P)-dependent oxidoreductase [Dokdonella sp.]|uniref:NAD(P)-dependent oxidoreductase n=1 Tax=Dokdonella sp. TaxID=2291710 RepID=UPI002BC4408C|nr:NAD(P)-dependent oxidoreductase [Dokdonella sp.]HUD41673.1 NAD(P)-dependent oxidoreductase [Dokdonella sp.]